MNKSQAILLRELLLRQSRITIFEARNASFQRVSNYMLFEAIGHVYCIALSTDAILMNCIQTLLVLTNLPIHMLHHNCFSLNHQMVAGDCVSGGDSGDYPVPSCYLMVLWYFGTVVLLPATRPRVLWYCRPFTCDQVPGSSYTPQQHAGGEIIQLPVHPVQT